jgi:general secretion pathway protein D
MLSLRQHGCAAFVRGAVASYLLATVCTAGHAQASNSNTPVSLPAGIAADRPAAAIAPPRPVSARQARAADDVYLQGAKQIERQEYEAAEKSFARALQLNPGNSDYLRAFAFAREGRVVELTHAAAQARSAGDKPRADALLQQAHTLDPDNRIVAEHLSDGADAFSPVIDPLRFPAQNIASTLAGPVELAPGDARKSFHQTGDGQSVLRAVYSAYGITVQFDDSVTSGPPLQFDLDNVTFATAAKLLGQMTKTFAVAVQPKLALVAKDTQENRDRLVPQVEETIYLRGMTSDQMQDLANLARNVYDVKNVTASATGGTILLRADEPTLKLVNAEYASMLDGGSDVMLDVTLYEIDKTTTRNLGVTFPTSVSAFSIVTELQNALNANQAAINAAIAAGYINPAQYANTNALHLAEVYYLFQAGLLSATQQSEITSLLGLGYLGTFGGLPLAGVTLASGATLTALLQTSDVRILDAIELRAGDAQASSFRSGTRYPIETSTYTTGASSAISSALAGASSAVQQLAAQYLGTGGTTTIPQIQFEDLGLTLKATPRILRGDEVNLALDLKIESLGGTALNGIPILNSRQYTSTVTVPKGKSAFLVSLVNRNELGSVQGFPGLNELPGFQGTNKDSEKDVSEILISVTPHVVREGRMRIESRRLEFPHASPSAF